MKRAFAAALALATMPAAASERDPLAGYVAGAPVDCVDLSRIDGPTIIDSTTILYRQSGRRMWRTGPDGSCPSLRPLTTLVVEPLGGRLCRGDRFRTIAVPSPIPSGYCRFTAFVPYDRTR